ncbi:MAG: hypothetical protein AAB564_02275 [Patescibacteria group bacterium]
MEKFEPKPKIVGAAPEKTKESVKERFRRYFYEDHLVDISEEARKELESLEYEKTPQEKELIFAADNELNDLMEKLGVPSFDIPLKNIHILPPELYKKSNKIAGNYSAITHYQERAILLNAKVFKSDPVYFGSIIFHEMFHLKGHFALEVEKTGEKDMETVSPFRAGLAVFSANKKDKENKGHEHFRGLEEAVTTEMEKRYFKKLIEHPILKEKKKQSESGEAKELKEEISQKADIPIDEIISFNDEFYANFSYFWQRKVLNLLVSKIYENNKDKFASPDEVLLDVFAKAHFTGRLLPMARLIKESFDKTTFEILGMMADDDESAIKTLEFLQRRIK